MDIYIYKERVSPAARALITCVKLCECVCVCVCACVCVCVCACVCVCVYRGCRDAAMNTKDGVVNDGRQRQRVKHLIHALPHLRAHLRTYV